MSLTSLNTQYRLLAKRYLGSSHLQCKNLLPNWHQGLVLRMSVDSIVHNFDNSKRIAFAPNVCRIKPLGLYNLDNKMTNVLQLEESVRQMLNYQQ